MSQAGWWEKVKGGGKTGFDKAWKAMDKLGAPVNRLSNKLGSEAFWPTTLDRESDKAARILKSFCKDGFYAEEDTQSGDGPKQKQKVIKKIPEKVMRNAKGLAIFTTMRTGLWISGAGGSGVLVARLPDGSWSPPSGILLHTAGLGFLVGVDIYDCVVVINSETALEAFTKIRCTLGSEISVAAGPVGAGGILDTEVHKRQTPIFTYLKSRGFYAGVQIDGTVIIERSDENERFYGEKIPVKDILAGKVRHPPLEIRRLMETIKAAQGDTNFDETALPSEPPPGDYVVDDGHMFGIPDKEDPDPYGVLALEKEGLSLKEAGTNKRASWEQFSFNPSPTSPVHAVYERVSQDRSGSRRSSWRASAFSNEPKTPSSLRNSMDQFPPTLPPRKSPSMTDMGTQTDPEPHSPSRGTTNDGVSSTSSRVSIANSHQLQNLPENEVLDTSPDHKEADSVTKLNGYSTPPHTPPLGQDGDDSLANDDEDAEDAHIEEPVVHSIQTAQPTSPRAISKVRIVNVPKRIPPKLPPRNPNRGGPLIVDASPKTPDTEKHAGQDPSSTVDAGSMDFEPHQQSASMSSLASSDHDSSFTPSDAHLRERLEDVKLEDDMDEVEISDPWAKAEAARRKQEDKTRMPGGFE
ncbi:hypothetical protein M433DRAFT_139792 [Acidomyces richmondensis BFW]|nr:MAG: hypothetical protein FE78DRAFT_80936 [Acidomyces sp. 'richmondensis']KYG49712.1 hypothetical protein M433DRAFT_139792 [Acidomyces richmondensis BFW]